MSSEPWVPLTDAAIERVWIEAAARCGFRVERTDAAYASTDGDGVIKIGATHTLDHDDSVAQLVLHELCHALIQGETNWTTPDWGLDNTTDRDGVREEACLRLQASLTSAHGLRSAMTPTTEWRSYYQALPVDPLGDEQYDGKAVVLAREAIALAEQKGMLSVLQEALAKTTALLRESGAIAPPVGEHPLGWALGPKSESCGTCAWHYIGGRGTGVERCRQSVGEIGDGKRVQASFPACERWEAPVDCLTCGACCREAYHTVAVSVRDPVVWKRPDFVVRSGHRWSLLRRAERCAALDVKDAAGGRGYACTIYEDRPRTCRDFERGGRHCLVARRRVGLSR